MGRKNRKIAIIGSGLVGSSCAYAMINQSICDEIVIISRNHEHALAQALDLSHCADFTSTRTRVRAGHYADCADADIVVMTAGANVKAGQTRMDIIADAAAITREVTTSVMASGFDGIFVVAANPVDVVTHITAQVSGLPRHRVIGTGTSIDSARLKTLLADVFQVDPRSVHGYAMGEHGESQFVAWSHVTIGGKPILHIAEEHKLRFPDLDLQDIARKTKDAGWEIFTRKGSTQFGIGSAIAYITRSILNDDHRIIAVSAILDGEYGQRDVCVGVPAIIGADGIEELIEFNLSDDEKSSFERSCEIIRAGLGVVAQAPLVG